MIWLRKPIEAQIVIDKHKLLYYMGLCVLAGFFMCKRHPGFVVTISYWSIHITISSGLILGNTMKRKGLSLSVRSYIFKRDNGRCRYCGKIAECVDHVIPYSVVFNDDTHNLVAACQLCNTIPQNKVFRSFEEKKRFIQAATEGRPLQEKREKIHLKAVWTFRELNEINKGRLRDHIRTTVTIVDNENDPRYILANHCEP